MTPSRNQRLSSADLIMAWAVDNDTGEPRYILQLDAAHRGNKSNCKCPSCNLPLVAVNAAKATFVKRPHFRHPEGAAREHCVIVAARKALAEMFGKQDLITLPRRRRSRDIEGLSGRYFDAWVDRPAEAVGINECEFRDEATAVLTLDDGRRLLVQLIGQGQISRISGEDALLARIELEVDDPALAMMSPKEIFERLELAWSNACWTQHWADAELDREAEAVACQHAADALDWLPPGVELDELTRTERRETLLHREVKAILERERRICLPGLFVEAQLQRNDGFVDRRRWSTPEIEVSLKSVDLEVHLGHSVPDVVVSWVGDDGWTQSMLIEVTVTNPIGDERVERISSLGFPALEIDIGRMGGVVTREELTNLVVSEIAGKRWLYHPKLDEEKQHLLGIMRREATAAEEEVQRRQEIRNVPASEWARRFLVAYQQRWQAQLAAGESVADSDLLQKEQGEVQEAVHALEVHGYAAASVLDQHPLRTIIARVLSIRRGVGVEYKFDNAWAVINSIRCDRGLAALKWHTYYLIAVRTYSPKLSVEQAQKVDQWRDGVKASIKKGEETFVRETVYDRLLGLLFPEMGEALCKPFGTPLMYLSEDSDESQSESQPNQFWTSDDVILRGQEFDKWARRNPEAARAWLNSPAGLRHQEQLAQEKKNLASQHYRRIKRKHM